MRAQGGSPNLINGVSRQPPEVRLPSQLEESVNLFPTVSDGLRPRNALEYLAGLPNFPTNSFLHFIDRDDSEKYVVSIDSAGVRVSDLQGNQKTVNAPSGYGYLSGTSKATLRAVTVADHTFILNTAKTAAMSSSRSIKRNPEALVHVAYAAYNKQYTIRINGSTVASITTPGGTYENDATVRDAERNTATDRIARALYDGNRGDGDDGRLTVSSYLTGSLPASEWTFRLYGYVLHIENTAGNDFTIECASGASDSQGYEGLRAHKGATPNFSLLPDKARDGFRIKVAGSRETDYDDYYVVYERAAFDGLGIWQEDVAQDIPDQFNAATMPHLLRREANGTFTFTPATWAKRDRGDETTNPTPTFIGQKLSGLVFHKNRLGFTWGESVVLSRNGKFFNFWVESAQTKLDTDPVDVTISYPGISTIYSTVPLGGELALFTSSVPFRLGGGEVLTPESTNISPLISNKVRSKATPVSLGAGCYFADDLPSGAAINEMIYSQDSGQAKSSSVTDHIPGYLPGTIDEVLGDESLRTVLAWSATQPRNLFVYKWLNVGNERPQSAWQKWTAPGNILKAYIIDDYLYVVGLYGGSAELWRVKLHEAIVGVETLLDRRCVATKSYDAEADTTAFTLPYDAAGASLVVHEGVNYGDQPEGAISGNTITVPGDYSGQTVYAGLAYKAVGTLSKIVPRQEREDGAGTSIPGTRTTISAITFDTGPSARLDVTVARSYRNPYTKTMRPTFLSTKTDILGYAVVGKLNGRVSVMANTEDLTVTFQNAEPLGFSILSYQWTGDVSPRGY